jgi:hypothetical protein
MAANEDQALVSRPNHYSPTERQDIPDQLLAALRKDQNITGVLIVGSGAEGFDDVYSDIDLCAVIAQARDVHPTFQEWGEKLNQLLPVFYCGRSGDRVAQFDTRDRCCATRTDVESAVRA